LGADHLYTLTSKQLLAAVYVSQQKHELAEPLYKEVLDVRRAKLGADHLDTLGTLHHLGLLYRYTKRPDLSIPLLEEVLKRRTAKLDPGHPETLGMKADLGISYSDGGRLAEAIALLEEVHQKNRGYYATPRVGDDLLRAYVRAGETTKAISLTTEEVRAAREMFSSDSPALIATIADAGKALLDLKAYADAEPLLLEAHSGLRAGEGQISADGNVSLIQALERLVQLYDAWGKPDKAAEWRKRLYDRSAGSVK
jgi:tetratricopeptide (TPR) repeat protein